MNSTEYELICPNKRPVPVTEFASCHLAAVPAHAVVTRPESRGEVVRILQDQEVSRDFFHHFIFLLFVIYILILSYKSRKKMKTVFVSHAALLKNTPQLKHIFLYLLNIFALSCFVCILRLNLV